MIGQRQVLATEAKIRLKQGMDKNDDGGGAPTMIETILAVLPLLILWKREPLSEPINVGV